MITAVCDSNVYISALVFGGMPREVVVLGEVGSIQLLASAALVSEVERVLLRKFGWEQHQLRRFCGPLWDACRRYGSLAASAATRSLVIGVNSAWA